MKNTLIVAMAVMLLLLVGCKKGTVSGKAINPFTGQPIADVTVWIKDTPMQVKSADGSFTFADLSIGKYELNAGKKNHNKYAESFELTEENMDVVQNIHIYDKSDLKAGLFRVNPDSVEKILNAWYLFEVQCGKLNFAYKTDFIDPKTKKSQPIPDAEVVEDEVNLLYFQPSSAEQAIEAVSFPLEIQDVAKNEACKEKFGKKEKKALFPVMDNGTHLKSTLISTNLYAIQGKLPKGKQAIVFNQGGKLLKAYYMDVK